MTVRGVFAGVFWAVVFLAIVAGIAVMAYAGWVR